MTPAQPVPVEESAAGVGPNQPGYPRNQCGVAAVPGLYFLGLLWQHSQASASLVGPGLDGPYVLETMNRHARRGFAPVSSS